MKRTVSVIIPAYNEEGNVNKLYREIVSALKGLALSEIIFVNDGSRDNTLDKIRLLVKKDNRVKFISFSRNFGHQSALRAGIDYSSSDSVIFMDADLQHPASMLPKMINAWKNGYDIVDAKRLNSSGSASLPKRFSSWAFYGLMSIFSNTKLENGVADFRLLDRRVVDRLKTFGESTFFLRGLVTWLGYKRKILTYKASKRYSGKTKYSISKMIAFAADAITSFSVFPLRIATFLGFFMSLLSGLYGLYVVSAWYFNSRVVTGWSSVVLSVLFIGGIQLMILGIIGEYIGKIFIEVKKRPSYIVDETNISKKI